MNIFNKIKHTLYSCYMCLRFPFLYPRHRMTNKHYTNWNILDKKKEIYCKWNEYSKQNMSKYYKKFGWDAFFRKYPEQLTFDIGDSDSESNFDFSDDFLIKNFILPDYVMKLADRKDRIKYWLYGVYHQILEVLHCIPTSNELDAMDDGWKKEFGIKFCKDLRKAIIKDCGLKGLFDFRIIQIKEKWGRFECYVNNNTKHITDVIEKYGDLSENVCICCGKKATKMTMGYVIPYCNGCIPKDRIFKYILPENDIEIKHNKEIDEMLKNC